MHNLREIFVGASHNELINSHGSDLFPFVQKKAFHDFRNFFVSLSSLNHLLKSNYFKHNFC